mmetsp:Transcript_2096/g.3545  ORF Transcript_2096/g.3545 Transcript_2096/m.3545 type:complete len:215 (+) Transcript_2096:227-871(+)
MKAMIPQAKVPKYMLADGSCSPACSMANFMLFSSRLFLSLISMSYSNTLSAMTNSNATALTRQSAKLSVDASHRQPSQPSSNATSIRGMTIPKPRPHFNHSGRPMILRSLESFSPPSRSAAFSAETNGRFSTEYSQCKNLKHVFASPITVRDQIRRMTPKYSGCENGMEHTTSASSFGMYLKLPSLKYFPCGPPMPIEKPNPVSFTWPSYMIFW